MIPRPLRLGEYETGANCASCLRRVNEDRQGHAVVHYDRRGRRCPGSGQPVVAVRSARPAPLRLEVRRG